MFLQSSFRAATRSFKPTGFAFKQVSQRLFSSQVKSRALRPQSASTLGLLVGASAAVALHANSKILNEVANLGTINTGRLESNIKSLDPTTTPNTPVTSRFGGKLQYRQLCYGSLIGLFTGVVIGKLSSVLGFITLSSILLLQTRGIISVPWTRIVRVGSDRINVRELFLEDPSFKISFALTFIIAAFNI
ncbi:Protein FUN14 [Cyberlindnera fabianii]|uniref:Protein FUN14 n=1 Tax=Cyberlindnera fabianii TaxID=36022 RepID=A0A1V2L795_CYBFA|nr:Protein FUN14 [Cyberlindnera fabianii]